MVFALNGKMKINVNKTNIIFLIVVTTC